MISSSAQVQAESSKSATIHCPSGKRAIAGGGTSTIGNFFITDNALSGLTGWTVRWESENDANVSGTVYPYVTCAPL